MSWRSLVPLVALLALVSLVLPSCEECGHKEGPLGASCKKNGHCREGLRCLKLSSGHGVCSRLCNWSDPESGPCDEHTVCKKLWVVITQQSCDRTHKAKTEFGYCIPHAMRFELKNSSAAPAEVTIR